MENPGILCPIIYSLPARGKGWKLGGPSGARGLKKDRGSENRGFSAGFESCGLPRRWSALELVVQKTDHVSCALILGHFVDNLTVGVQYGAVVPAAESFADFRKRGTG
jgi:hypothetical protein